MASAGFSCACVGPQDTATQADIPNHAAAGNVKDVMNEPSGDVFSSAVIRDIEDNNSRYRAASLPIGYGLTSGNVTAIAQAKASALASPATSGSFVRRFTHPLNSP